MGMSRLQRIAASDRRSKVVLLTMAGKSVSEIARVLAAPERTVRRDVAAIEDEWLRQVSGDDFGRARALQVARLESIFSAFWPAALKGHAKSAELALRVLEREARLLGLDAPAKQEHSGTIETSVVEPKPKIDLTKLTPEELDKLEAARRVLDDLAAKAAGDVTD